MRALFSSIDDGILGYALATLITQTLVAPITALAAAIVYFELKDLHGEPVAAGRPAAVGPGSDRAFDTPLGGAGRAEPRPAALRRQAVLRRPADRTKGAVPGAALSGSLSVRRTTLLVSAPGQSLARYGGIGPVSPLSGAVRPRSRKVEARRADVGRTSAARRLGGGCLLLGRHPCPIEVDDHMRDGDVKLLTQTLDDAGLKPVRLARRVRGDHHLVGRKLA